MNNRRKKNRRWFHPSITFTIRSGFLILSVLTLGLLLMSTLYFRNTVIESTGVQGISLAEEIRERLNGELKSEIENHLLYFVNFDPYHGPREEVRGDLIRFLNFFNAQYEFPLVERVVLYDGEGMVLESSGGLEFLPPEHGSTAARTPERRFIVDDELYYSPLHEKPILAAYLPVSGEEGRTRYIVLSEISALEIFRNIEVTYTHRYDIETRLISPEGRLLFESQVFQFNRDLSGTPLFEKISGATGYFIIEEHGKKKIFSFSGGPGSEDERRFTDWILLVGYNMDQVLGRSASVTWVLISVASVLVLASIIAGIFISRAIKRPVDRLIEGSVLVARGELGTRISWYRNDELGNLAHNFNAMVERLESTIEQLNRTNRDLSEYAYAASHDLQEPLRAIAGFLQILNRRYSDSLDATGREYIRRTVRASERLQGLIGDLLTYSRIRLDPDRIRPCDADRIFTQALSDIRKKSGGLPREIRKDTLPVISADPEHIRFVFDNLLANAVKFRHPDHDLEVDVASSRKGRDWTVTVTDNGIGFDQQYADQVFDLFKRLHSREDYEGTGIGLAVCKRIAQLYAGDASARAEPDKGTAVMVHLRNI